MTVTLPSRAIFDRRLSAPLLRAYLRLLAMAWTQAGRAEPLVLTFAELRDLLGTAQHPAGHGTVYRYLRNLRAAGYLTWHTGRHHRYCLEFPGEGA